MKSHNLTLLPLSIFLMLSGMVAPLLWYGQIFCFLLATLALMTHMKQNQEAQETKMKQLLEAVSNQELFTRSVDEIMEQNGESRLQLLQAIDILRVHIGDAKQQQLETSQVIREHIVQFHEMFAEQWEENSAFQKQLQTRSEAQRDNIIEVIELQNEKIVAQTLTMREENKALIKSIEVLQSKQDLTIKQISCNLDQVLSSENNITDVMAEQVNRLIMQTKITEDGLSALLIQQLESAIAKSDMANTVLKSSVQQVKHLEQTVVTLAMQEYEVSKLQRDTLLNINAGAQAQNDCLSHCQNSLDSLNTSAQLQITALADHSQSLDNIHTLQQEQKKIQDTIYLSSQDGNNTLDLLHDNGNKQLTMLEAQQKEALEQGKTLTSSHKTAKDQEEVLNSMLTNTQEQLTSLQESCETLENILGQSQLQTNTIAEEKTAMDNLRNSYSQQSTALLAQQRSITSALETLAEQCVALIAIKTLPMDLKQIFDNLESSLTSSVGEQMARSEQQQIATEQAILGFVKASQQQLNAITDKMELREADFAQMVEELHLQYTHFETITKDSIQLMTTMAAEDQKLLEKIFQQ